MGNQRRSEIGVKEGKKLLITELGNQTTDMLTEYFKKLISIHFSAEMESDLDLIAEEKANWVQVLSKFYTPFMEDVKRFEQECPALPCGFLPIVWCG